MPTFFKIAQEKIKFQLSLIRSTDKLAMFFTAVNNMIDTKQVVEGREFLIEQPKNVTGKDSRGDKHTFTFEPGTNVLFLRLSAIFAIFDRGGYNTEEAHSPHWSRIYEATPLILALFLRAALHGKKPLRFQETMIRKQLSKYANQEVTSTSAIIIDYDKFMELYNIDFRRTFTEEAAPAKEQETPPAAPITPTEQAFPFPPMKDRDEPF